MKKTCISKNWYFKNETDNTDYVKIDLPHDYQIVGKRNPSGTPPNGFYPDKTGSYVKHLVLNKGKHYVLYVDGAYMCAQVFFNEELLTFHPYGYTPFLCDLTPYVRDNVTNKIKIKTAPTDKNSRWYSGNGLYRDVFLYEGGFLRIEPWDLFVHTKEVQNNIATVKIKYVVSADKKANATIKFTVKDGDGVVCEHETTKTLKKGKNEYEDEVIISSVKLWDVDNPNLYVLTCDVVNSGVVIDQSEITFGVKTVSATATQGLILNGKAIKLKGGCIHHDHGEIGSCSFPVAEERKVRKLKEAGFNAIRCAHNPPSLAFLQACDKIGMIVMDEAFDCWNIQKPEHGYHMFFADWWERDIESMVKRDRNHACVFSYSIGNEVLEINGTSNMAVWAKRLANKVRELDDTKFVTSGLQKYFLRRNSADQVDPEDYVQFIFDRFKSKDNVGINKITDAYEKELDIVGVNYYYKTYELDHEMNPDRVLWGSETQTVYFYDSWQGVMKNPYVLGDFTWTAYDSMGEVGAGRAVWGREKEDNTFAGIKLGGAKYPWRNCYQGDLDLCGSRRPQSYFREAIWNEKAKPRIFTTHPDHYKEPFFGTEWHWKPVEESWTFDDIYVGKPITAETYTVADTVKWYVNDKFIGESSPNKGIATIDTIYERGNIRVETYKNGEKLGENVLYTTGKATTIKLSPEKSEIFADNRDLCFIPIELVDNDGKVVNGEDKLISCKTIGADLVALFSGNPAPEDKEKFNECKTFKGRALAVVRTNRVGNFCVTVSGENVVSQTATIKALSFEEYKEKAKGIEMISLPIF